MTEVDKRFALIRDAIASRCTEEQFRRMRCPKCAADLLLRVSPRNARVFVVGCAGGDLPPHFWLHGRADGEPPGWWRTHVGGTWVD